VDYPDFAKELSRKVLELGHDETFKPCGVLVCGSGVGMSIGANRFKGIRAALCFDADIAKLSREHNASNVLCLGSRLLEESKAIEIFKTWVETSFEGGRHQKRIELMDE